MWGMGAVGWVANLMQLGVCEAWRAGQKQERADGRRRTGGAGGGWGGGAERGWRRRTRPERGCLVKEAGSGW